MVRSPSKMIAGKRSQRRPGAFKRPKRSGQLKSAVAAMAALSIIRRPKAPRIQRKTIRPSNGSAQHRETGTEFLSFIPVPIATTLGTSLFVLEANPTKFPRLAIFASQYKQWKGDISLKVESLGNAFATSSVSVAFIPDPNPAELPTDPTSLLRVINSAPSQRNLHLQSQGSTSVNAPWKLSTNPWKFVQDDDPSDRANGLFVIVANGSPGTVEVPLKVSASYNVLFQGNTFNPLEESLPTVTSALYGVNNFLSSSLFTPTTGAKNWSVAGNNLILTYPSGTVPVKYYGNWTPLLPQLPFGAIVSQYNLVAAAATATCNRTTLLGFVVTATSTTYFFNAIAAPTAAVSNSFVVLPRIVGQ
nr:MAG: structural polyprotein [Heilongjiang sediment hepe-like virus 3]